MSEIKPERGVSSTILVIIVIVFVMIISLIYASIIFFSGLDRAGMGLWIGIVSLIFAVIIYFVHAVIGDPVTLGLFGVFTSLGFISFYGAIFLSPWEMNSKIITAVILSVFLLILLVVAYRLRRYGELQEARILARKKRRMEGQK